MARRLLPLALVAIPLLNAGCSTIESPRRPAWREQAEKACIAEHRVRLSRYIAPRGREIDGPGICGLTQPYMVGALADDSVQLDSVATLDCPMVAALNDWVTTVVQPTAQARFGQPVVQIDTMGSYACRGMNGQAGARISEHAFGNAIDIGGFRLADGRRITLVRDWTQGDEQAQSFLRDVHAGACQYFTTVLGPGANIFHYNHIHVDLAMHGGSSHGLRHICKPVPTQTGPLPAPRDQLPEAPAMEEEQDVASGNLPVMRGESARLDAGAPSSGASLRPGSLYTRNSDEQPRTAAAHNERMPPEFDGAPQDWYVTSSIPRR